MRWIRISFVEHAIRILVVAIVALITADQAGWLTRTRILPPAAISPLEGHAFQIQVVKPWYPSWFLSFFYPSDSMSDPAISSMQLTEGLRRLGPPHSPHRDVEEKGDGRFSHWYNWLYFSASDNRSANEWAHLQRRSGAGRIAHRRDTCLIDVSPYPGTSANGPRAR
jgi:hypothetical protein